MLGADKTGNEVAAMPDIKTKQSRMLDKRILKVLFFVKTSMIKTQSSEKCHK